jgi:hypothetical protein
VRSPAAFGTGKVAAALCGRPLKHSLVRKHGFKTRYVEICGAFPDFRFRTMEIPVVFNNLRLPREAQGGPTRKRRICQVFRQKETFRFRKILRLLFCSKEIVDFS